MKRLLVWAIPIIILLSGLYLNFGPDPSLYRLAFPGQSKGSPSDCETIVDGNSLFEVSPRDSIYTCGCTLKGVQPTGFPFKSNLYDYCSQNDSQIKWIDAVDIAIIFGVAGSAYYLLNRLIRKNT